jgi:hypothetical protein
LSSKVVEEEVWEWDGYVEAIETEHFVARLRGLRGPGVAGRDEEMEVPLADVRPSDRSLVQPGAYFRLCLGYKSDPIVGRDRYSRVTFRRLPAYSPREIDSAKKKAEELIASFRLEEDRRSAKA